MKRRSTKRKFYGLQDFGAISSILTLIITAVTFVFAVYTFIDQVEQNKPSFSYEYALAGERDYYYLLKTTKTYEGNVVIDSQTDVTAYNNTEIEYKLFNSNPGTVKDAELAINQYLVVIDGEDLVLAIPVKNVYDVRGSYSFSNEQYRFYRRVTNMDEIIDRVNEKLEEQHIPLFVSETSFFVLDYICKNGKENQDVTVIGKTKEYSEDDLIDYIIEDYVFSADVYDETKDNAQENERIADDMLEVILKNCCQNFK